MFPDPAGQLPLAQTLLGCGAKLETRNKDGNTPLWLAGLHDRMDVVGALIAAKADKEAKDEVGVGGLWVE